MLRVCSRTEGTSSSTAVSHGMVALLPAAEPTPGMAPPLRPHVDARLHRRKPGGEEKGGGIKDEAEREWGTGTGNKQIRKQEEGGRREGKRHGIACSHVI